MYYCLLRELVYHLNLNYTKFRLAFLEVSSGLIGETARIGRHLLAAAKLRRKSHIGRNLACQRARRQLSDRRGIGVPAWHHRRVHGVPPVPIAGLAEPMRGLQAQGRLPQEPCAQQRIVATPGPRAL